MKMIDRRLVASCGMNCAICSAYLAYKNNLPKVPGKSTHCPGCRPRKKQCAFVMKQCPDDRKILRGKIEFCFECNCFPCAGLERLDDKYRLRYGASMIDNLKEIKRDGLDQFIKNQVRKYKCSACGELISVHSKKCYVCDEIRSWKG